MSRFPERRTSAIQTETKSDNRDAEPTPSGERSPISVGWRVAIVFWLCGFVGLFLYELWGLVWKIAKRMF